MIRRTSLRVVSDRVVAGSIVAGCVAATIVASGAAAWTERLEVERRTSELTSTDRAVRREAARRLGLAGEHDRAVEALTAALGTEIDHEVRTEIADALARRRDPRAIEALIANVARMRDGERAARLRALAAIDRPAARRALAMALGGDGAERAMPRIVELGAPMVDELVALLDVPPAAIGAARALGAIGDHRGTEALMARASAEDLALRVAALEALGAIGDERAVGVVLAQVEHEDPSVAIAALRALARLGSQDASSAVSAQLARDDAEVATTALQALTILDPERARPALERALASEDGARRRAAWAAMVGVPDAALVPLLVSGAADVTRRGDACDALARIDRGGGVAPLIELASAHGGDASVALARALRRWTIASELRARALASLAGDRDVDRAAQLRAVARDEGAEDALLSRLGAAEADARVLAAQGLAMGGRSSDRARSALRDALASEADPIVVEAMARALDVLGGRADAPSIEALAEPSHAAAALSVAAIAIPAPRARERRALRRAILEALHATGPRTRALAAHALARRGDRDASTSLAAALEDRSSEVRLAAASALGALGAGGTSRVAERLASRLAVEPEAPVRRAIRDALEGSAGTLAVRGDECLHVRLARPAAIDVELVLPDGRWLRARTLTTGELIVCDLPTADVDVRLAP